MGGFLPTILPALDAIRSIGGLLGVRVFKVTVRRRVWTGRPGAPLSEKADFDTVLVNQAPDGSLQPVRVQRLSRSDVMSSGGRYTATDYKVGPMSPPYIAGVLKAAGGFDDNTINPAPTGTQTELIWILSTNDGGTHGIPAAGSICELKGEEATAMHYYAILRSTGRVPM